MAENQRIQDIRQKVRDWLDERITEGHPGNAGEEMEKNIRSFWPDLFPEGEAKPVTNRHALIIAEDFLREAVQYVRDHEDDPHSMQLQADLAGLSLKKYEKKCLQTIVGHNNLKAFMASADKLGGFNASINKLAGNEELSLSEAEKHIRNVKLGSRVMRDAEELIQGGTSCNSKLYDNPKQMAILDALDHAEINFDAAEIKKTIDGRGRDKGTGTDG